MRAKTRSRRPLRAAGARAAFGYIRVSTGGQAENGVSLAEQETRIRRWASSRGLVLVRVYSDTISGRSVNDRPGVRAAVSAACEEGGLLVVASLSRLARSLRDLLDISSQIEDCGAGLVSLAEDFDTSTASGRLFFHILGVLGEFERRLIAERTRSALRHLRAQRRRTGGIPYGFNLAADGQALIENANEQDAIKEMCEMRRSGQTLRAIAAILEQRGIPAKNGGTWAPKVVADVVRRSEADAT
jgi:DNA invertase Pin-like site-specific DNA recombinase